MRGKRLLLARRLHLFLSVFFAPLLLLFVVTGWAQTMGFVRSSVVMEKLSRVHTSQYFPTTIETNKRFGGQIGTARNGRPPWSTTRPTKLLVAAMCVALLVSIALGLVLAFTMVKNRIPVWIALILGVATPVVFLALAHLN
jgi:hypothetical protein